MNETPWEDDLLERKVESDFKDVLKTLVAFANSVKPDQIATLLIGEKDDGTVQGVKNPDNIQKKITSKCNDIYPPIGTFIYQPMKKRDSDGAQKTINTRLRRFTCMD